MKRSSARWVGRTRRMLRRLPSAIGEEIGRDMVKAGPAILGYAQGQSPHRSGKLRSLLTWRFYARSLRLRVGLLTKAARREGWYGVILERGRRAQTVNVKRRTANGIIAYKLNVRAFSGQRFDIVEGRVKRFAFGLLRPMLNRIYSRGLAKAAGAGGGE